MKNLEDYGTVVYKTYIDDDGKEVTVPFAKGYTDEEWEEIKRLYPDKFTLYEDSEEDEW